MTRHLPSNNRSTPGGKQSVQKCVKDPLRNIVLYRFVTLSGKVDQNQQNTFCNILDKYWNMKYNIFIKLKGEHVKQSMNYRQGTCHTSIHWY